MRKTIISGIISIFALAVSLPAFACQEVTASNTTHVSQGRAEIRDQTCFGSFCFGGTYYAVGSGDNLGTGAYTSTTLSSNQSGTWQLGSCPSVTVANCSITSAEESLENLGSKILVVQGSVTSADVNATGVEFRIPGSNNYSDWTTTVFNASAKTFTTQKAATPILAKGSYTIEARAVLENGVYGPNCAMEVTIANHAPVCTSFGAPYVATGNNDDYGRWVTVGDFYDQDNNMMTPQFKLNALNKSWRDATKTIGWAAVVTDAPGELTLGQSYEFLGRAVDLDGLGVYCPIQTITATDNAGAVVTGPETIEIELGDNFNPLASGLGIAAIDDYSAPSNINISVVSNPVDTSTAGEYEVIYEASDEAGNDPYPGRLYLLVKVIDPNQSNPPSIISFTPSVDGLSLTVSGTASDDDNDLTEIRVTRIEDNQSVLCTGTNTFTCEWTQSEGTFHFEVTAYDSAGNQSAEDTSFEASFSNSQCITTTNQNHIDAGRAELRYNILVYAKGSSDYLGLASNTTSLKQSGNAWNKVSSCN